MLFWPTPHFPYVVECFVPYLSTLSLCNMYCFKIGNRMYLYILCVGFDKITKLQGGNYPSNGSPGLIKIQHTIRGFCGCFWQRIVDTMDTPWLRLLVWQAPPSANPFSFQWMERSTLGGSLYIVWTKVLKPGAHRTIASATLFLFKLKLLGFESLYQAGWDPRGRDPVFINHNHRPNATVRIEAAR